MSASILDRLNARIAAEPSLDHLDTIFVDLQDARDTIVSQVAENTDLKDMLSAPPAAGVGASMLTGGGGGTESKTLTVADLPAIAPTESVPAEVRELLLGARERLSVNALSTVADYLDKAIKLTD